ncbi:hypothetical protein Ae201684P_007239 [Aphanomyces euteiches]|uniref:Uncharacterized protein n=1 Tax=Aphanomyces euteiches TaxID=100861 RepID=A0A6G0X8U9_9STRA|nr:hypothetical protein Ae201684_007426 [Aphanomyces euteiches]KAH9101051.1 hypothetical protein Ae201684P_007239 [Aphanomyces euteiches]
MQLAQFLLEKLNNGRLPHGTIKEAAAKFECDRKTVRMFSRDGISGVGSSRKKGRVGRKKLVSDDEAITRIRAVELRNRQNIRTLAAQVGLPYTTLFRKLKAGVIRRATSTLSPSLTDACKYKRLLHCLSFLRLSKTTRSCPAAFKFHAMLDWIHLDEKWFFLDKDKRTFYLVKGEELPSRTARHKSHIPKLMFLTAVGRPQYDHGTSQYFDGKLGIFPFVIHGTAKRSSRHQAKGAPVLIPQTVTRDIYVDALVNHVLPAILTKFPSRWKTLYIQQDGARPHCTDGCPELVASAASFGLNIKLVTQPANSPDLNILDLGFFAAIQTLQYRKCPKTIDEFLDAVHESFHELKSDCLDSVWLSLHRRMATIIDHYGDNTMKLEHMRKEALRKQGKLPLSSTLASNVFLQAFASLHPEDRSIYQSWVDQIVHQYRPSSSSFEANASAVNVCDLGAVLDEYFEAHEDHETNLAALCDDSHFDDISVDRLVDMMNDLEVHVDA